MAKLFSIVMLSLACLSFGLPLEAGSADLAPARPAKARKIVAAGFGFQNARSSHITVKTYDAETGEVLSDESYELDIKEEGPSAYGQPSERIFAGGVGLGADGLSEFMLRVYDAANGRFLWEGRLNLGVSDNDVEAVPILARIQPRAAVLKISQGTQTHGQPYFVLRAVDPETGQLMWADQFSTNMAGMVRPEHISRSVTSLAITAAQDVDFRIKMFDEAGHHLLWEDQVRPAAESTDALTGKQDEAPAMIPGWSPAVSELTRAEAI